MRVLVAKKIPLATMPPTRPRLTAAEREQRQHKRLLMLRRYRAQVSAAANFQAFFRRVLVQSAGMLVVLAIFGTAFLGRAQNSATTYRAAPTQCSGWQQAENATSISLLGNQDVDAFTPENSATITSRKATDPVTAEPLLKCKGFALPEDFPTDVDLKKIQLSVSLAARGNENSDDALVIESSLDGQQWSTLDSFFLTEDASNALNGGYRTFDFPALNKDNLGSLQVRVRFASIPSDHTVQAYVDGLALVIDVRQLVSAESLNLPANVIQVEKRNVSSNEEPVVKVEVEKQARLKFLGFKDTKRTVDEVNVTTPEGTVQVASYDVQNVTEGGATFAKLNIHTDKFTKPGAYTAQITVLQDNKLAIVTTEFTWGVLVINMNRSVYWPGETVYFGMGVLDADGHTVCDAKLVLTIVAPDGTKTVQTTEQTEKSVQRSNTCGPDNVTDVADYNAEFETFDEGNYAVTLTASSDAGEYTITDTVVVDAVIPFAISRRGSMRIYPPAAYTMALDVRPQKDFQGVVEDYAPPSFVITNVSDGGKVIKEQQRTIIRWNVDWQSRTTHTLTYRYDAPDISPELFRLGPVHVGEYQESRQWQIASDAVGSAAATRLYTTGFERNSVTANHEITGTSGTAPTISTSTIRSGTYALRTNPSSAASLAYVDYATADTGTARMTLRAYMRVTTLPSADTQILTFYDGAALGSPQATIHLNGSGDLKAYNEEDGAQVGSTLSAAISTGTWYRLELAYHFGTAATGDTTIEAMLNGNIFASSTTINHANGARRFGLGVITSTSADIFFDDVGLNQDAFVGHRQWVGEGKVVLILTDGNGSSTSWAAGTNAFDEAEVDDTPAAGFDDATTYVQATATGNVDDYTLASSASVGIDPNDSIRLVEGWSRASSTTAASGNHFVSIYDGTTAEVGSNNAIAVTTWWTNDDSVPRNSSVVVYDDLGTTTYTPITPADIDGYQIRLTTSDVTPNPKVTAVWALVEYVPAEGGRLWTSGFELQSATAGMEYTANIGSPTINTTTKRYGAASMRTNPSSATMGMSYSFASADVADDFYFRAYVYMATRPTGTTNKIFMVQDNAGTDQASLQYDETAHTLELWNEEDNVQIGSDSTVVFAANTWYMLELKVDATTIGSTVLAGRIDNVEFASGTVNHANGVKTLALGMVTTVSTADMYWDDVAINQGTGATQNTYPGPGAVVAMQPDAVGDNTAWNVSVSCAAVDYTCVNEVPPNDATTAVATTTINQIEENNLESSSSAGIGANDRITLVHAGLRFNASSAVAIVSKMHLKANAAASGGSTIESYNIIASTTTWTTNAPSGPMTAPITAYDQPNGSSVWTPSALDTTQIGVRLTGDAANNFQVSNMWLMVEYVPQITLSLTLFANSETATGFSCNVININLEVTTQSGPTRNANNAGTTYTCTASDGTYTTLYADAPNNVGDIIVISADNTFVSSTALLANSTTAAISGVELRDQQLMLMKDNTTTISNAILAKGDNGDADIVYTVSSNNISLTSGISVLVGKSATAYTYDPGGTVTTTSGANGGDFHVNNASTAYLDTATNTIGRDILVDDGSTLHVDADTTVGGGDITTSGTSAVVDYSGGTPKVTMSGGSGSIGGGTTPTITFYDLDIAASTTISLASPATVNHDLRAVAAASAIFNVNADLWVGNDIAMSGGAIITTTSGTPTVTLTCTDATCNLGTTGQTGEFKLYSVTTNGTSTVTLNRSLTLMGTLTVGTGTVVTYANTPVLTMLGSSKSVAGPGSITLYDLTIGDATNAATVTLTHAARIDGSIVVGASSTNSTFTAGANITYYGGSITTGNAGSTITYSGTPTLYTYVNGTTGVSGGGNITFYNVTIGDGALQNFFTPSSAITIANDVTVSSGCSCAFRPSATTVTVGGNITATSNGQVTYVTSGTVIMTGTSKSITGSGAKNFYNLQTSGTATITLSTTAVTVGSDLTIGSGTTLNANVNVTVSGGDVTGDGTLTYSSGTPTFSVNGTGSFGGATAWTFYKLDFINTGGNVTTTAAGAGGITINNQLFTRIAGDGEFIPITYHTLKAGAKTWTLTASGVGTSGPFQNESNKFEGETSTFLYTGTSATDITMTNNATTNYFYNLQLVPASDVTVTYKLTAHIINNNLTMGRVGTFTDVGIQTVDASTNDPNITVGGTMSCNVPNGDGGVSLQLGAGTWTLGNLDTTWCWLGVSYDTGSTVTMALAGGSITNSAALYNVNIDPSSAGTVTSVNSHSVYGTLTVASGDSYSINASRTTTLQASAPEIAGTGTITGSGKIAFVPTSSGPGTTVTINAITLYNLSAAIPSTTFDARTYGNDVEITNTSGANFVVTCASGTYTLSGASSDLLLLASGAGNVTLDCSTGNPTWSVGGNVDYTTGSTGTESITTGTGTWTVSGNVDLTAGTLTATATNTLIMDGTSKTLTSNSQTWQNVTLSGTITMASSTHTVNGNLTLSGTVTCGATCGVLMTGTANDLVGGGNTIGTLSINPSSAGTITLKTSDLTISGGSFTVAVGDALTLESGRNLTVSSLLDIMTLSGTINGPGRFIYADSSNDGFPTGGTLATGLIVRFNNTTALTLTVPARADYQYLEIDNSGATAGRTVTAGTGTITIASNLDIMNTGSGSSTTIFNLDTSDPTFTVTGVTTVAADTTLTAPSGGALNLGGNYTNNGTFTDSGGTVTLNGSGTQSLSGTMISGSDFNNLVISNTSGSVTGCATSFTPGVAFAAAATISGTYTITTGGVKVQYNSGSTYTVTNINWVGASGNLIYFRNSNLSSGTWILNVSGTQTVQYVNVQGSDATSGVDINANDGTSVDCTGNTGWVFTSGIDIAGTSDGSSGTVKVAVNGSIQAQTTTLAGSWTITGVSVSSGNVVTVFVDAVGEAAETTGVTKYDGTGNIGGMVLNANVLTVGSDDNASLVLTDLGGIDNDDNENIMHTANASTITVDGGATYSTEQISLKASNTLTIGTTETLATHHLDNAGTLVGTGNATFNIFGNWTNSSTFTHNTSTVNFKAIGTGKTINNGASSFYNVVFDGSGGAWSALTNTMTVANNLTVTNGTFDTATGTANVVVNGNVQCGASCGTINMTSTNTFTQSVATSKAFGTNVAVATNWTFYNLTFTASAGTPTITFNGTGTGQTIVGGTLSTTNSGTSLVVDNETNDRIIDANGAVTLGSGTTLQASSTAAFTVAGNWTNNGDFTDGTGTVTLDGGSQQTIDGQLTGANDRFYDLTITNASGSNPETSPSVIFAASADVADDFTASTASTKLRFLASGTYTFQKITFNGGAVGTRVALRSSSTGTSWALNVAGTRAVSYTDVRDSNACGQAPNIDATDGTNFDSAGNNCWDINTLTFAINDVAVGFGTLSPSGARWASADATGSGSAVAAHTLAVSTNARNGYVLSYFGPSLVGAETITAATFTGDADGTPGGKQFAMSITTDGDATIPSAYQKASNNYSFVPSTTTTLMSETGPTATETASAYYLCNIATSTLPGAYSTSVTYVLTSTY